MEEEIAAEAEEEEKKAEEANNARNKTFQDIHGKPYDPAKKFGLIEDGT